MDELGWQVGALGHRQVGAHAQGLAVAAFEHLQLEAVIGGDAGGGICQGGGGGHVGGGGHQLAGQLHAGAEPIDGAEAGLAAFR